ncbi:unnamed protein product [Auanema sp. JU1783]|nr:unnamed protein product [Auanema sp. JU1783]
MKPFRLHLKNYWCTRREGGGAYLKRLAYCALPPIDQVLNNDEIFDNQEVRQLKGFNITKSKADKTVKSPSHKSLKMGRGHNK